MNFKLFIYIHSFCFVLRLVKFRCMKMKFWGVFHFFFSLIFKILLELNGLTKIGIKRLFNVDTNYSIKLRSIWYECLSVIHTWLINYMGIFCYVKTNWQCDFIYENIPEQSLVGHHQPSFCYWFNKIYGFPWLRNVCYYFVCLHSLRETLLDLNHWFID